MCDKNKQRWDEAITRPPNAWSMPEELKTPKERNTDLRPYSTLIREHLDEVHERESEIQNHEPDVPHDDDHHAYLEQFKLNLIHIADWKQYEQLELLIQLVDLGKVTTTWLDSFREDLDLKV